MTLRTRSRGQLLPYPDAVYRTRFANCSDLSWTSATIGSGVLVGILEEMRDTVTPSWAKRRAKGEIVFNPMSYTKRISEVIDPGVGAYFDSASISCAGTGTRFEVDHQTGFFAGLLNATFPTAQVIPVKLLIPYEEIEDLVTEVSTRCLSERGKADNNLFESVAEYKQTLAMLKRPQDSLFKFFNKNGERMRKLSPENAWLAYRYGVKPFIKDVQGIIEGLGKAVGSKRITTRSNGEIQRSEVVVQSFTRSPVSVAVNVQTVDAVKVRAMSLDEYVATAASNIGFTTKGLLTLPWELVPYSFVADWFVNVGDFLGALAPAPEYKQLGSCLVVRRFQTTTYSPIATTIVNPGYRNPPMRNVTGQCYGSYETRTRVGLGAPGLVVKSNFKLDDSVRRADAIALLKQQADRFFKR